MSFDALRLEPWSTMTTAHWQPLPLVEHSLLSPEQLKAWAVTRTDRFGALVLEGRILGNNLADWQRQWT
jgi:hypothetical protein